MATSVSTNIQDIRKYPNPFFDLSKDYIPKDIRTLFKYCRTYFYTYSFLRNAIFKLATYPITNLIFEGDVDPDIKKKYKSYWDNELKLKTLLIGIGLDYFVLGNAIILTTSKFKRHLKCKACKKLFHIDSLQYKFQNFKFQGTCPSCKHGGAFEIEDIFLSNDKALKFIRKTPEKIDIDYDEHSGESDYYYKIETATKKAIEAGKKEKLNKIPEIYIAAAKENKKILLDPKNVYHLKAPTLAEDDQGFGIPFVLPALKDLYYYQTLRRGNEAIATEHIVPKKYLSPGTLGNIDPFTQMDLGAWKNKVVEQLDKWKQDPNHIGVFPIPLNYQSLGGDARALSVTPELKFIEEVVVNGLGLPLEFIKGGVNWTSSSVSLRIVENYFLFYREFLLDFLNNFLIPRMVSFLGYPSIKVKFAKFKMSDDVQAKEYLFSLNQSKKVSDKTLREENGIDNQEEMEALLKEKKQFDEELASSQKSQAVAQGEAQVVLAKYQARAQYENMSESHRIKERMLQEEIAKEQALSGERVEDLIEKLTAYITTLHPKYREMYMNQMLQKTPVTYALVLERLLTGAMPIPAVASEPAERESGNETKEKKSNEEKTHGPTRGEP